MKAYLARKIFVAVIIVMCGIALFGCATIGNKQITNNEIVSQVKAGKSTKAEVKSLLGEPSHVTFTDTNEEIWEYYYSRSTMRPASLIPIVGILAGGSDIKTHTLTIRFTKEGIVKEIGKGKTSGGAGSIFD